MEKPPIAINAITYGCIILLCLRQNYFRLYRCLSFLLSSLFALLLASCVYLPAYQYCCNNAKRRLAKNQQDIHSVYRSKPHRRMRLALVFYRFRKSFLYLTPKNSASSCISLSFIVFILGMCAVSMYICAAFSTVSIRPKVSSIVLPAP